MPSKDTDCETKYSETVQGEVEGILAVPENLESRLPELKRRYLEYRRQKGYPDLPVKEVVGRSDDLELSQAYRAKPSVAIRNRLVQQNIGLVRKVAYQVSRHYAEPYEELVQVGSMGLIGAIERFEVRRGHSFSSFGVPYIRGEIQQYLRARSSLDAPVAQEDSTFSDILPDSKYHGFQLVEKDRLRLRQALRELEAPKREILECVYFQGLTQVETARRLGLSPTTVSRRLKSALRELWHILDAPT